METDLLPNVQGTVQTLRNKWSAMAAEQEKPSKPPLTRPASVPWDQPLLHSIEKKNQTSKKKANELIRIANVDNPARISSSRIEKIHFASASSDQNEFPPLPEPPPPVPTIIFKQQAQSIVTLKQSVNKMLDIEKKITSFIPMKSNGMHRWQITRHVFRSGLLFRPSRRASDSILPLLMKTHRAQQHRTRADSLDSLHQTPFETLINYLTYNEEHDHNSSSIGLRKSTFKRTTSDTIHLANRGSLNDTIVQYESIMRHLKNYDKFMATCSVTPKFEPIQPTTNEENPMSSTRSSISNQSITSNSTRHRQTQSLARHAGRTFTEFFMNDFLLSPSPKTTTNNSRRSTIVDASSQTELAVATIETIITAPIVETICEETKAILTELDNLLDNTESEPPITANSEVHVIIKSSSTTNNEQKPEEQSTPPLMARLFNKKKTAYTLRELAMESTRIPDVLAKTYETAKKKCFFPNENVRYATSMTKIDRRGYKQRLRILCLTNERLYNVTKKNPYPKEALLFDQIDGLSCTPFKDGFICIHSKPGREDRGDWLVLVEHPCEFITQLFMAMGRENNDDQFLKFEEKIKHIRRHVATSFVDEGFVEARLADEQSLEQVDFENLIIYTP